jgi:CelD/BcsL family acetyltransferase involved in cellulose biosynthesis
VHYDSPGKREMIARENIVTESLLESTFPSLEIREEHSPKVIKEKDVMKTIDKLHESQERKMQRIGQMRVKVVDSEKERARRGG